MGRYLCEPPFKDELATSWIVRNALLFGMMPRRLSTLALKNTDAWKADLDVYIDPKDITLFSISTGIEEEVIRDTTLYATCHHFYNQTEKTTQVKWVMPISVKSKNQTYGLQYCPCCLAEDGQTPYFRKSWRLGFITCCLDHSVQLHDRCPSCKGAINIKRPKKAEGEILYHPLNIAHCSECGFDLRVTEYTPATEDEYEINRINYLQALHGYGKVANLEFCYSNLYFEGIRRLLSFLICSPKGEKLFLYLRKELNLYQVYHRELIGRNVEPERLNIDMRRTGLLMAYHLLQDWPKSFVDACRENNLTSYLIKTPYLEFPFWVVDAMLFHIKENKNLTCDHEKTSIIKYFSKRFCKDIAPHQVHRFVNYYFIKGSNLRI